MVGVAEFARQHRQAAKGVAHLELFAHAHATVQLHRFLADVARGVGDLDLGRGDRARIAARVDPAAGEAGHGARLLERDEHVHHPVLQRLEGADRRAELLARLEVLEGRVAGELHRTDRFRAYQRRAQVGGLFQRDEVTLHRLGLRAAEHDIGREALIHRAISLQIHLADVDQKQPDRTVSARAYHQALGARRLLADDGIRVRQARVAQRRSLAAHAHGQTVTLCRSGQNCVDLEGRGVPTSHRGEHERRVQALAEQRLAQIDLVEIELGQGFVVLFVARIVGLVLGPDRPDQVAQPHFSTGRAVREDYFGLGTDNASFFNVPLNVPGGTGPNHGRFGTLGRNTFRGPGLHNFDIALVKDTPFGSRGGAELGTLEFRAEFFNVFNIVNFGLPNNVLRGSGFGIIGKTASSSRQIQFSLKVIY